MKTRAALGLLLWLLSSLATAQVIIHPGVLESTQLLNYVHDNLDKEPWKSALSQTVQSKYANLSYKPRPWATVECGSGSNPNHGCSDETDDATAAYTQALLWRYKRDKHYAANGVAILDAWANTLKGGHTHSNAPLQAAWAAELFTRAAEILKYTDPDWAQPEEDKVTIMFREQYLPDIRKMFVTGGYGCYNGNWHASGVEAMLNIAVFNKDTRLFNEATAHWHALLPAYIYLKSDGARPRDTPWCPRNDQQIVERWYGQRVFVDGLSQETCRDFGHVAYGLAAIINAAETARIHGVDLYTGETERITKAMEFHAAYQNGESVPSWLCHGSVTINRGTKGTLEIGYNHYAIREGKDLPRSRHFLETTRPTSGEFHYRWETLTHGLTGNATSMAGAHP